MAFLKSIQYFIFSIAFILLLDIPLLYIRQKNVFLYFKQKTEQQMI